MQLTWWHITCSDNTPYNTRSAHQFTIYPYFNTRNNSSYCNVLVPCTARCSVLNVPVSVSRASGICIITMHAQIASGTTRMRLLTRAWLMLMSPCSVNVYTTPTPCDSVHGEWNIYYIYISTRAWYHHTN